MAIDTLVLVSASPVGLFLMAAQAVGGSVLEAVEATLAAAVAHGALGHALVAIGWLPLGATVAALRLARLAARMEQHYSTNGAKE